MDFRTYKWCGDNPVGKTIRVKYDEGLLFYGCFMYSHIQKNNNLFFINICIQLHDQSHNQTPTTSIYAHISTYTYTLITLQPLQKPLPPLPLLLLPWPPHHMTKTYQYAYTSAHNGNFQLLNFRLFTEWLEGVQRNTRYIRVDSLVVITVVGTDWYSWLHESIQMWQKCPAIYTCYSW